MRKFHSSQDYLNRYQTLKDGYYEYWVDGRSHLLFTRFSDCTGWIRVVTVDWNNQDHINEDAVQHIKPHDGIINALRTDVQTCNVLAEAYQFKAPFNEWATYPVQLYVHQSMERFSSVDYIKDIRNANCVAVGSGSPIVVYEHTHSRNIGFGTDQGDTFFAYGNADRPGFAQEFSGPGRGEVFVR